ncbi:MAG TPA: diguanylate cyclase [Dokdonella sp.]
MIRLPSRYASRRLRAGAFRLAAALLLLLAALPARAADYALAGAWRAADADEPAAAASADDARLRGFDPARLTPFAAPSGVAWVLLQPAGGAWPDGVSVLQVTGTGLQTLTLYLPGAEAPREARFGVTGAGAWPGHGRLAFPIETPLPRGAPIRVRVDARGVVPSSLRFALQPAADYVRADARWLAIASACLAVMLAMALTALFFALRLGDATFLYYAAFVSTYAFILALQGGYAFEPLGWSAIAAAPRVWGRVVTTASIVFAVLFLVRFADLSRYAPLARRVLFGYAAAVVVLAASMPLPGVDALGRALINPLLIAGGPLLIGAGLCAAWRGSRYARFFLAGWTPLLGVTVLSSLQLYGIAPDWTWSDQAELMAGAFEALVLSLGLADRALALRRAHEQARRLAYLDPLTGLYNRRGWGERLLALEEAALRGGAPLSVLFLDIDRFKALNDRHGHEAGDAALRLLATVMRAELREKDAIGRYGGEEFVVALPGADAERALQLGERIRRRVRECSATEPPGVVATVSIGVATLRPDEGIATLLRRADRAMYAAKQAGRDRVVAAETLPEK